MQIQLINPLNKFFKDEVCALGTQLAIHVLGDLIEEKLKTVCKSNAILREEIATRGLEHDVWQYLTVNPDVKLETNEPLIIH